VNLKKNLVENMRQKHKAWLDRCDWCSWPLSDNREDGCVPGDCSQRPRPRRDDSELREDFRMLLAYIESDASR
jgi:hypothetical protein